MAKLKIISNDRIVDNYYKICLEGDNCEEFVPGQFVNISTGHSDGMILKRPLSVYDLHDNVIEIIYEVRGKGTHALSCMTKGMALEADYFLGNGFDLLDTDKTIMLVGGGIGVAPLYSVLSKYKDRKFYSYLGFASSNKAILRKEFTDKSNTVIATDDGSLGECGVITKCVLKDIKEIKPDVILACGPKPMLKALQCISDVRVLVSVEERMGCGIGACLVCVCKTVGGHKRVCKDGPVFNIKELIL